MNDFDSLWTWWVETAPFCYLKYVDYHMFVEQPAGTQSNMTKEEVRACWRNRKHVFESSFVMKHWLLIIVRSVHAKQEEKHESCIMTTYWEKHISKCFDQPFTFLSPISESFKSSIEMLGEIVRLHNTVDIQDIQIIHLHPSLSNINISIYQFETMFKEFRINCNQFFMWDVIKSSQNVTYYAFPFIEHLARIVQQEIDHTIHLPSVLKSITLE